MEVIFDICSKIDAANTAPLVGGWYSGENGNQIVHIVNDLVIALDVICDCDINMQTHLIPQLRLFVQDNYGRKRIYCAANRFARWIFQRGELAAAIAQSCSLKQEQIKA